MKQKLNLTALIVLACLSLSGVCLSFENASAFMETKSGSIESNFSIGSGNGQDQINQFLSSYPQNMPIGPFFTGLMRAIIRQAGKENYPATDRILECGVRASRAGWDECLKEVTKETIDPCTGAKVTKKVTNDPCAPAKKYYDSCDNPCSEQELLTGGELVGCAGGTSYGIMTCFDRSGYASSEISKIKTWLSENNPGVLNVLYLGIATTGAAPWISGVSFVANATDLTCKHTDNYNYSFRYNVNQDGMSKLISDTTPHKCEEIKLVFSPGAEWLASFAYSRSTRSYYFLFGSPPTAFLDCADQASCLDKAVEYALTPDTFGKGVQKVPADFVAQTEKSLNSSDPLMKCADGTCVSYTSGNFPLTATAPASSYFGQCRGYGATIDTPETPVPAVTSSTTVNIANRAPVPAVNFAKNPIVINEEVDVACDIVDPDECSDKIAKVKWGCTDSNGNSNNCEIWKADTGEWGQGTITQNLVSSEQSNPYRATAKFRASQGGSYAVTCEATDNDANNPLTGTGIAGIEVVGSCGEDGVCNPNCNPPDPDCAHCGPDGVCVQGCNPPDTDCVIAAHSNYCALLSLDEGESKTLCNESEKADYVAYASGKDQVVSYNWKCDSSDKEFTETKKGEFTCSYQYSDSGNNTHLPVLQVMYKGNTKPTECITQTSTSLAKEGKCTLKIRKSGSDDESSTILKINTRDTVVGEVQKSCIPEGKINWIISPNGILGKDGNPAEIKFDNMGSGSIKAEIVTPDGKTINCGEVDVEVKEKVQFST